MCAAEDRQDSKCNVLHVYVDVGDGLSWFKHKGVWFCKVSSITPFVIQPSASVPKQLFFPLLPPDVFQVWLCVCSGIVLRYLVFFGWPVSHHKLDSLVRQSGQRDKWICPGIINILFSSDNFIFLTFLRTLGLLTLTDAIFWWVHIVSGKLEKIRYNFILRFQDHTNIPIYNYNKRNN